MYYFGKYENIIVGGAKMIVMDLKVDNFFAFKNFHINMSYPKKIIDSNIKNEFLEDKPNFRYKKVNIIMGSNATGKTSIGQMLMQIFNFIDKKEFESIARIICDKSKSASFSIDLVSEDYSLFRLETFIFPNHNQEHKSSNVNVNVQSVKINKNDSYEKCIQKFSDFPDHNKKSYIIELEKISNSFGWFFTYPTDKSRVDHRNNDKNYLTILSHTLRALDSSIEEVIKLPSVDSSYVIKTKYQDLIVQDGQVIKENLLSSGTKAGLDIASMIYAIKNGTHGFYYCDEKFSYVHSDVEKAFISVIISSLKSNDQIFITTHNTDILDLELPKHTYTFLKKDISDSEQPIKCINVSDYLKRNTDSVRNAVDNDLFSAAPSLELIYEIAEL